MRLRKIANNQTEIQTDDFDILISYETPVACYNKITGEYSRTGKKWSATTSKHINTWLPAENHGVEYGRVSEKPQEFFDNLIN